MPQLTKPPRWRERRAQWRARGTLPLVWLEWFLEHVAYALNQWAFIDVLKNVLQLVALVSVVLGAKSYLTGEAAESRQKQKHYQAWQVINSAQGKGGSGGRIDALQDLVRDGVSLAGVNLSGAWLDSVRISGAVMPFAVMDSVSLNSADLSQAVLFVADLSPTLLIRADLRGAELHMADLSESNLRGADFHGAILRDAHLTEADLSLADFSLADLREADLNGVVGWPDIRVLEFTNLYGVKNPPKGFLPWALNQMEAVCVEDQDDWQAIVNGERPAPEHPTNEAELEEYCSVTYTDEGDGNNER